MKLSYVSCLAACVLASACVDPGEQVATSDQSIVGGVNGNVGDYPTVVAIINNGLCTGTLIAPDLILTAAHCIHPGVLRYNSQAEVTAGTRVVFDADNIRNGSGFQIQAAETMPHPSFTTNSIGDNDIGLIRLSQPVTDRTPTPINRIFADAAPGVTITQVGYGVSTSGDQNSGGQLRLVAEKLTSACGPFQAGSDANLLCWSQADGHGKCEGDSGGPSFLTVNGVQRIVGVTSFGDRTCTQFGADTRVDGELSFLYERAPNLQCQSDGACNDACGKSGLPEDADCPKCTQDSDCGDSDLACVAGYCEARPLTPGGLGSECTSSVECDSGICGGGPDGNRCTDLCTAEGNDCPDNFDCIPAGGGAHACWPGADSDGGGCTVAAHTSTGSSSGLALWLLLGIALATQRRRRNR